MRPIPLLDTHLWLWWLLGDSRITGTETDFLDGLSADKRPYLCDISIWEAALLVEKGRVELDCSLADFLEKAASPATVRVLPITARVAVEMGALPDSFHRDPADRLIVSTARAHGLPMATRDRLIEECGLVEIWT